MQKGKTLESLLETQHEIYRRRCLVDVSRHSEQWKWCAVQSREYGRLRVIKGMTAVCTNGYGLKREKSEPDYEGGNSFISVKFDAKETAGQSIPLANFKPHQVDRLVQAERCGVRAGFVVWFYDADRFYWLGASYVDARARAYATRPRGKRAPRGLASISIDDCETYGFAIPKVNGLPDWLETLMVGKL